MTAFFRHVVTESLQMRASVVGRATDIYIVYWNLYAVAMFPEIVKKCKISLFRLCSLLLYTQSPPPALKRRVRWGGKMELFYCMEDFGDVCFLCVNPWSSVELLEGRYPSEASLGVAMGVR